VAIELAGVRYRYAGTSRDVLRGIDLRLEPGRVLGIAGANESGKTTLSLVASGFAPVVVGGRFDGTVTIDGERASGLPAHTLAQRCGLLFQDASTQLTGTTATVFEEVAFGPCALGLPFPEVVARVEWALATVGIVDLAPRPPGRLSGGQAQLVALASVLALRPKYLLLDEPTSELDPAGTALVADALARVAAETGAGILLVEHKTDVLARIAHEVVVLDGGAVALRGPAVEILADPRLAELGVEPPAEISLRRQIDAAGGAAVARASGAETTAFARIDAPSMELEAVSFTYPDGVEALHGVSLRIEPGESVAIVGQNGSGKSTLARHLNGLLRPTSGRVLLDGRDIATDHVAALAGRVGLAFQNPDRQLFAGSASGEVAFGPRNLGVHRAEIVERVRWALDAVGLADESGSNPYDLGYSRRKLLALASVLAMRTPILVLDEPTTGQDARGVGRVRAAVAGALSEGRTVVAISHDMRFAAECFARVVVMRGGSIVLDGSPAEVFAERNWPELRAAYLEPPAAAVSGAGLGLGSTPTAAAFIAALRARRG
jgi:energy-coupling factor transport system ATP-binding protein